MCSTNERPPTPTPGTQHTKINEGRYFQQSCFINVGKSWGKRVRGSLIIFSREGTEFLTNEMEMECITCLVLLSTHPVHHLIQIRFLKVGFAPPGNTISNVQSTSFLGADDMYHFCFYLCLWTRRYSIDTLEKLHRRLFSNAIEPWPCLSSAMMVSNSHTHCQLHDPARPVSVSLACTPTFIRW